jgi:carboxyl-terminal processing protease
MDLNNTAESQNNIPNPKRTNFIPKIIVVALVFVFGFWLGQTIILPFTPDKPPIINLKNEDKPREIQVDFAPFWQVWSKVTESYLERTKIDPQDLLYGAIKGMVEGLGDPYTVFLPPDENKEFLLSLSGTYEGVGIELDIRDERLVVVSPIANSPASKAGVRPGDIITYINDDEASRLSIQEAVKKIRGKADTQIRLMVERNGKELTFNLTRAEITLKSAEYKDLGGGIAHIKVTRFGDNTLADWNKAVTEALSKNSNKLILDLRNNPGGRLDYAVELVSDFVPEDTVALIEEESSGRRTEFKTEKPPKLQNVKVVVLINKGSASASEIVAGALRDLKGIALLGETSFGKGTIQRVDDFPDGSGLHLTFAKWLTPKGTWVHGKGIKPDVEVALTEADFEADKDPQLDRAIKQLK